MAQLNRYFQKPTVEVDMLSPQAADSGAEAIGQGLRSAGQSIGNIAERDEDFWVQKTLADADQFADKAYEDAAQNTTDGAPDFEKNYASALDKQYSTLRQQAPTGRAARALELGLTKQRNAYTGRARGFESQERTSYKVSQIDRQADDLGQHAMRNPGVEPYSPQGRLIPPGTVDSTARPAPNDYYTNQHVDEKTGSETPDNLESFKSSYYAPQDFADGKSIQDKSGAVMVSKRLVSSLDWVTDQFGMGKLQINSGYRSPSSNLKRAESGADGPHTHGEAVDIQVGDLPQGDKNRLYSLLKTQGFNAFGFGEGVLHAEIRPGQGSGRGGDFEWTYKGASKYSQVPVANGDAAAASEDGKASWKSPNQYPYLAMAGMTASSETGKYNMVEASATIAPDASGTKSYGMFGLNSGGTLQTFVDGNPDLGLTATPGTPEFDQQWQQLAAKSPQKVVDAQLRFHERKVVVPAQRSLVVAGLGKFSNDPRAVAFVSDMVVQYGPAGVEKHLLAAAGSTNVAEFVQATSDSMRDNLDGDFRSALSSGTAQRNGLLARIDDRAKKSLALTSGGGSTPITGNVPAWNGPIPDINDVPMYQDRLERIDGMVDTMGGTPEQRRKVRESMRARVVRGWLSTVAETNPSAAMAALHSGRYDDVLTMGDEASINGGAEQSWRAYEGEIRTAHKQLLTNLQTEAHTVLADEIASLSNTGRPTGALSDAHQAMLTDDDRENLALAKFQYDIGQKVSTARNDELPGILEQLTPQGDGFATEQKKFDFAQKLIGARQEKQRTDPAGYVLATSKQLSDSWQAAMASNDPNKVQASIQTIRRTQQAQGVPEAQIRSVTQTSQENNEKLLEGAADADQAFSRFTQLRRLYGGESGAVFAEMEKDGGRKGWSAVNELMESGNVVLAKSLSRVVHANAFKGDAQIGLRLARAGDSETARTIFEGRVRRETMKGLEPAGESQDGKKVNQILGEAMGDALGDSPQVMADAVDAAKSYFARGASLGEEWTSDKLETAINKVTGGILEHNSDSTSGKFIAPVAGMTQDQFDRVIPELKDSDLKGAFVGYSNVPAPVTAEMVRDKMQLVSAGNGRYFLRYPNAGLARDEKGLPYMLDIGSKLSTLAQSAAKRRKPEPVVPDAAVDPYAPGGMLSNFDPETGLPRPRK